MSVTSYLPGLGRWQTVDPLWWGRSGGLYGYLYCSASPTVRTDPSGLAPPPDIDGSCCFRHVAGFERSRPYRGRRLRAR